jgi:hypothetical protein
MSSRLTELPDSWVAINPTNAYGFLSQQPFQSGLWLAVRRPLFIAFVLACDISLIAGDPFNARLVAAATVYWSFVPLAEALALVVVCWGARRRLSLSKAADLFFSGHAPWLLWFTVISVIWGLQSPQGASAFVGTHEVALLAGTAVTVIWCGYIDFCFFSAVLGWPRMRAAFALLIQRLISWALILVTFSWASLSAGLGL